ncbi:hypothetical protein SDC9_109289 [bioreactor metagenome]|uniref:Uncharacterized protein n=1 Tax=bioreactor metagenome TaxID=1076179 RepID=A0A645BBH6_9ZZZZ
MFDSIAFLSGERVKKSSWKRFTCSLASTGRFCDKSCESASIRDLPPSRTYIFSRCFSAKLYDFQRAYPTIPVHTQTNTIPNKRICLKLLSIFFKLLNSIYLLFYFLISFPEIFPVAAPAAAPARFPPVVAVLERFRFIPPSPPA